MNNQDSLFAKQLEVYRVKWAKGSPLERAYIEEKVRRLKHERQVSEDVQQRIERAKALGRGEHAA